MQKRIAPKPPNLSPPESMDDADSSSGIERKVRKKYKEKMDNILKKLKLGILQTDDPSEFEIAGEKLEKKHEKIVKEILSSYEEKFVNVIEERRKLRAILNFQLEYYKEQLQIHIKAKLRPSIGIDLGTTYSCVSVCFNGEIQIMPNEVGKNTTPSYLGIDGDHTFIGQPAKEQAYLRPLNTVFDAKRLIGRNYDDPIVQKDIELWPFEVINIDSHPVIRVEGRNYLPEEISAAILKELKRQAEEFLSRSINDAVITVPAYFNNGQRQATKKAGELAGFNVLRILNEPTAAAITYNLHRIDLTTRNVLIYDLGGGTFDVSVLTIQNGDIKIKSVGGDTHLGGEDFDNAMVDYCMKEFKAKHDLELSEGKSSEEENIKFQANKRIRRLRNECEKQKISLSATRKTVVVLDAIMNSLDLSITITRDTFEELIKDHLEKCMQIVKDVIQNAGLEPSDIDDIVLVGGSSHIPDVKQRLKEFFPGKSLCQTINPDEAVAKGAAIQACLINEGENNQINYTGQVSDVTPLSLGVTKQKIYFSEIIPKNTPIPCEKVKSYTTRHDNQQTMKFPIYEGEDTIAENNYKLGEIHITNIPAAPKGEQKCDVVMRIDEDGIFTVQASMAENKENQKTVSICLNQNRPKFTVDELNEECEPPESMV